MPRMVAEPTFTCDECGAAIAPDALISYKLTLCATGHPGVASFECPDGQHYACSPEHAKAQLDQCFAHMEQERQTRIQQHVAEAQEQQRRRAAAQAEQPTT